jgi:hypothetical protein
LAVFEKKAYKLIVMRKFVFIRTLIVIWLAWAAIMITFQVFVSYRFEPKRPDHVLNWTPSETGEHSLDNRVYLNHPFMNNHVAWDSEYYLSIATSGTYDDPNAPTDPGSHLALNYAFFPFYPLVMRTLSFPLRLLGLAPIAASTLAGVLISALGTLAAMLALYDLTCDELGDAGALRTAYYLIIFPSGFFLLQVYTEGLFVGLSFAGLALIKRKRFRWAAVLSACAALTRPVGVAMVAPLAVAWYEEMKKPPCSFRRFSGKSMLDGAVVLLPVAVHLMWSLSNWGEGFRTVQLNYFGHEPFAFTRTLSYCSSCLAILFGPNKQSMTYYSIEFAATLLGFIACILTFRRYPGLTGFGFLSLMVSLTSGAPLGMHRYVLAVPSTFVVLARMGRNETFDRTWTLASILLMGLFTTLFTFNMWTG